MTTAYTPMVQQYLEVKRQHEDELLFFRLGDFYEMFFEDALTASRELNITLTGRAGGMEEKIPMAVFDQFSHFGNRNDRIEDFFRKSKRKAQIGIRIDICSQNRMAFFCIKSCKGRCDGCFSYATLSSYCYFHFTPFQGRPCAFYTPSAARFSSIRASIASPSLSMSFSTV